LALHGVLHDGVPHRSVFPTLYSGAASGDHASSSCADCGGGGGSSESSKDSGDGRLGRQLGDEWWVKAKLEAEEVYRLCRGKGRNSEYKNASRSEVDAAILATIALTPLDTKHSQSHL
jgi:hypothetical protein